MSKDRFGGWVEGYKWFGGGDTDVLKLTIFRLAHRLPRSLAPYCFMNYTTVHSSACQVSRRCGNALSNKIHHVIFCMDNPSALYLRT
jgi:hypothetical protein